MQPVHQPQVIMSYKIYQIDAFANQVFSGNPAAICPLTDWLDVSVMQKIAAENNLSETAFYVKKEAYIEIRWFTPTVEVDLCGHATLAAAYVLFEYENYLDDSLSFFSHRSGILSVTKSNNIICLNFPTDTIDFIAVTSEHTQCFNIAPLKASKGKSFELLHFKSEDEIRRLNPNLGIIKQLDCAALIVTAPGDDVDFVSRCFAPQSGVNEDPVTGSAHTTLIPYWHQLTDKQEFIAQQLSSRGGDLYCKFLNDRVEISGQCKTYLIGEIYI